MHALAASCVQSRQFFFSSALPEQLFELKNEEAMKNLRIYATHVLPMHDPIQSHKTVPLSSPPHQTLRYVARWGKENCLFCKTDVSAGGASVHHARGALHEEDCRGGVRGGHSPSTALQVPLSATLLLNSPRTALQVPVPLSASYLYLKCSAALLNSPCTALQVLLSASYLYLQCSAALLKKTNTKFFACFSESTLYLKLSFKNPQRQRFWLNTFRKPPVTFSNFFFLRPNDLRTLEKNHQRQRRQLSGSVAERLLEFLSGSRDADTQLPQMLYLLFKKLEKHQRNWKKYWYNFTEV